MVNPASSATVERTFAMPRRVRTLLREDMNQQKFYHVAILQTNKASTDISVACR